MLVKEGNHGRIFAMSWLQFMLAAATACAPSTPATATEGLSVDWPVAIGDEAGARWSALSDIDTVNVVRLVPDWSWSTGEEVRRDPQTGQQLDGGEFQATPIAINDTLYVSTPYSRAVALDGVTGKQYWQFDADVTQWGPYPNGHSLFSHRGLAVWSDTMERRVFLTARWKLWALDARTGIPVRSFGANGSVDLSAGLRWRTDSTNVTTSSPPAIWHDLVIVGSSIGDEMIFKRDPPGHVQAYDARTGARVWQWDPVPPSGERRETDWLDGSAENTGHSNVWSFITVDSARGLVYLPVSAASNDWYGGARLGDNRWSESLVCLDARTGRQLWARQLVHHGLWDYDLAAPPTLATVQINGFPRDIVAQAGKTGFLYVLDRVTGEPIWPIEERAVPPSDVPGERTSPTQPMPTWPLPFAKQGLTMDDANNVLPDVEDSAKAFLARVKLGPQFTPPSIEGTIVSPGWIGGAGWGATALNPVKGVLYIKSTNEPILAKLVRDTSGGDGAPEFRIANGSPRDAARVSVSYRDHFLRRRVISFPISKPPYGTLTAIDLSNGKHLWQVVVGDPPERARHPKLRRSNGPPMGVAGPAGGLVTAGGLIFLTGGGTTLFALRESDGAVLWQYDLGQIANSNPMTFRTRSGRQMVGIATGKGQVARLQLFVLPEE